MASFLVVYYFTFVALCTIITFFNYRIGLWLALIAGLIADPVRKLTPDNPLYITIGFAPIVIAVLISMLSQGAKGKKLFFYYPQLKFPLVIFIACLLFSAFVGTINRFPIMVILISLVQYLGIIIGVRTGYYFARREKDIVICAFLFVCTLIPFLTTVLFHFLGFDEKWPVLETMGSEGVPYLQFHTDEPLVMLNGVFRSPEVMGWYAMMSALCALFLIARGRSISFAKLFYGLIFLFSVFFILTSGRRKMFLGVVAFLFTFMTLLLRKNPKKLFGFLAIVCLLSGVGFMYLQKHESAAGYLLSAKSGFSAVEERVESGVIGSMFFAVQKAGFFGKGLGAITQGARHVQQDGSTDIMIEAGTGKFLGELGIQGFLAACLLVWAFIHSCYRIITMGVVRGRIYLTASFLFSLTLVHLISFAISYQIYADPLIGLLTGLSFGMLLAIPKMARITVRKPIEV